MKNREAPADPYIIRKAGEDEAEAMFRLMRRVWEELDNKDLFAVEDTTLDWVRSSIRTPGFGIVAEHGATHEMAGMLIVCFPGLTEENDGYDIGLSEALLPAVAQMECAAVLPEHRGHHLEERMLRFGTDMLQGTEARLILCTISPHNPASLTSALRNGYEIMLTKEKYGGHLRHILMKKLDPGLEL